MEASKSSLGPVETTSRGFEIIRFTDRAFTPCVLQQSSAANGEKPGGGAVWLGLADGHRMHLEQETVIALISSLQQWVETGSFDIYRCDAKANDDLNECQTYDAPDCSDC